VGDRPAHFARAREALAGLERTTLVAASAIEETEPIGPAGQAPYLNQMALLRTGLTPRRLLAACHAIERAAGRVRGERWGARSLDLDIVRFGSRRVDEPDLVVPHPELPNRTFWQRELQELLAHAV